ncbi:MAG: hypothetical protein ACYDCM_07145 [Candidatus Acidiferrales bacterium]
MAATQILGNVSASPFAPVIRKEQTSLMIQYIQQKPFERAVIGTGEGYYRLIQQFPQMVSVGVPMVVLDAISVELLPANEYLFDMASQLSGLAESSALIFANSRQLSSEERSDLKKFYRKAYKKV